MRASAGTEEKSCVVQLILLCIYTYAHTHTGSNNRTPSSHVRTPIRHIVKIAHTRGRQLGRTATALLRPPSFSTSGAASSAMLLSPPIGGASC